VLTTPNGDKIQPGIKFIDIRTKYRQDPYYDIVYQAYLRGEAPVLNYAVAMGVLATYFPDMTYKVPGTPSTKLYGDVICFEIRYKHQH